MSDAIKTLQKHLDEGTATEEELANFARMYDSRAMQSRMQKLQESVEKGDIDASKVNAVFVEAETKRGQREAREKAEFDRATAIEQARIDKLFEASQAADAKKEEASK